MLGWLAASTLIGGVTSVASAETLVFMGWSGNLEREIYEAVIRQFERDHAGVKVDIQYVNPADFTTRLVSMMAGGVAPDVFYVPLDRFADWAAAGGVMRDLAPLLQEDSDKPLNVIWPAGVSLYRYDGKVVGRGPQVLALPKDLGPWAMVYNIELYNQAGVPLPDATKPMSWDEAVARWKKLTRDLNGDGTPDVWGMAGWPLGFPIEGAIWSNGADFFNADMTALAVNTPAFVEAVQWVADLSLVHRVATPPHFDNWPAWIEGKIATFYMGPWDQAYFWEHLQFPWDIAPWPASLRTGQSRTWVGSMGIAVSATSKQPKLAYELVKYLVADKAAQTQLFTMGQMVPNRRDLLADFLRLKKPPEHRSVFIDIIGQYGRVQPWYYTRDDGWWNALNQLLASVYEGKAPAGQLLVGQYDRLQALYAKNLAR